MKSNKFSTITEASALIGYLSEPQRINNVRFFNKYMRLSSVVRLFSSGLLLINNPSRMNDLYEYKAFGEQAKWSKICFASFITQSCESMAMWSMYAQPWTDGVMISIPVAALKALLQNTHSLISAKYDENTRLFSPSDSSFNSDGIISITRVAYIDQNTLTVTNKDDRNTHFANPYRTPELAGYIKDAAWSYEKEVRLRVDLPDSYAQDVAFLKLSEDFLNSICITTGPRFAGNALMALPERYRPKVKIETSRFKEALAWIPCDNCDLKRN